MLTYYVPLPYMLPNKLHISYHCINKTFGPRNQKFIHHINNIFSPFQKMNPQLPMEVDNPLLMFIKRNMVLENLVIPVQKQHLLQPVQKKSPILLGLHPHWDTTDLYPQPSLLSLCLKELELQLLAPVLNQLPPFQLQYLQNLQLNLWYQTSQSLP